MSSILKQADKLVAYAVAPLKNKSVAIPIATIMLIFTTQVLTAEPSPILKKILHHPIAKILFIFIIVVLLAGDANHLAYMSTIIVLVLYAIIQRADAILGWAHLGQIPQAIAQAAA